MFAIVNFSRPIFNLMLLTHNADGRLAERGLRPVYSDTTQLDVELNCVGGEVSIATPTQLNSTQLDVELSTRSQREQLSPINERSDPVDSVCRS